MSEWSEDIDPKAACPECGDQMPAGPDGRRVCDNFGCGVAIDAWRTMRLGTSETEGDRG